MSPLTASSPAVPSVPRNLTVTPITADSITVDWMEPEVLGDTSVSYNVTVNATDARVTVKGLSAVISGLTAGTAYNISVTARNSVGASEAVTDVFMTPDRELTYLQTYAYTSH